jgi:beta-galactosidase
MPPLRLLTAAAAALAFARASSSSSCVFPSWLNGTEVYGLTSAPSAGDVAACAAACCASGPACTTWQWCEPGGACAPAQSCWIGGAGTGQSPMTGWVGATRPRQPPAGPLAIGLDAPVPAPVPLPGMPPVPRGGPAPNPVLGVTSRGWTLDGQPWLPVGGELHYSRVAPSAWASVLRTMRAGGLSIVSAYTIMLHHNEVEGTYDFSGARNLSAFLSEARDAGMLVSLRVGPYCHGEVRGGGLPDWLQAVPGISLRSTQPLFMQYAKAWYAALAQQLAGHMWQDGGAVITVQLDNESGDGPYLVALRDAAVAVGLVPPFFVATGLNDVPFGSMLPLAGAYPVAFWDGGDNSTSSDYLFAAPAFNGSGYPALFCELGGGMAAVYCDRHAVAPLDIGALAHVTLASGGNDLNYYMYVGGSNPQGALSTLQERQQFYNGQWDLPVLGYDFVAPIGISGAVHAQYHSLRAVHLLANDPALGSWLAPTASALPDFQPSGAEDGDTLRWAARYDGNGSALLFFSSYARNLAFSAQTGVRLALRLPGGATLAVPSPSSPALDLPTNALWAWPVNQALPGGLRLVYGLAQPAGVVDAPGGPVVLLLSTPGVPTELAFADAAALRVLACAGTCAAEGGTLYARALPAGRGAALQLLAPDGTTNVSFVVLDEAAGASRLWLGDLAGARRAFLADAGADTLFEFDGSATLRVRSEAAGGTAAVSILPAPATLAPAAMGGGGGGGSAAPLVPVPDGLFSRYTLSVPAPVAALAAVTRLSPGAVPPRPGKGAAGHAVSPGLNGTLGDAWPAAAVFSLALTGELPPPPALTDVRLIFNWTGDAARLYLSPDDNAPVSTLLADVFYNAPTARDQLWATSLTRQLPPGAALPLNLTLRILPLRPDVDDVIALDSWPPFGTGPGGCALDLRSVELVHTATIELVAT